MDPKPPRIVVQALYKDGYNLREIAVLRTTASYWYVKLRGSTDRVFRTVGELQECVESRTARYEVQGDNLAIWWGKLWDGPDAVLEKRAWVRMDDAVLQFRTAEHNMRERGYTQVGPSHLLTYPAMEPAEPIEPEPIEPEPVDPIDLWDV